MSETIISGVKKIKRAEGQIQRRTKSIDESFPKSFMQSGNPDACTAVKMITLTKGNSFSMVLHIVAEVQKFHDFTTHSHLSFVHMVQMIFYSTAKTLLFDNI